MSKYWIANDPNSEVNTTKAQRLATISAATAVSAADLDRLTTGLKVHSSITALAAAGTLVANTVYNVTDTDTAIYALPAAASSTAGDTIVVKYDVVLANTEKHDYGTAGEFLLHGPQSINQMIKLMVQFLVLSQDLMVLMTIT